MQMTLEKIVRWWESNDNSPIYGFLYGGPYVLICNEKGESHLIPDEIIRIEKSSLEIDKRHNRFIYIWGYPGPDYNAYKFTDYGKTWAFSKDEIEVSL